MTGSVKGWFMPVLKRERGELNMRVTILGASGQLALCLRDTAPGEIQTCFLGREKLDLGADGFDLAPLEASRPDLVINASAYTAVDKAESDADAANALNAKAPARLSAFCEARAIPFVHISTDYVFDGRKQEAYRESDMPSPLNIYGQSKLAGEQAVAAACSRHVIIRTSWLYSPYGHNFMKTMLRLAGERDELSIVADQIGCPTSAHSLARAIWQVVRQVSGPQQGASLWGLYHYADAGIVSWAGFAETIFLEARDHLRKSPAVEHIPTKDYPTPAQRPLRTVLDCSKFEENFGVSPPELDAGLRDAVRVLYSEAVQ